jgi:hypothetical protein
MDGSLDTETQMILRNSAKCNTCDTELESRHRHDFRTHTCPNNPKIAKHWVDDKLVELPGEATFNWGVDGGKDYIRRIGEGFTDTSEITNE